MAPLSTAGHTGSRSRALRARLDTPGSRSATPLPWLDTRAIPTPQLDTPGSCSDTSLDRSGSCFSAALAWLDRSGSRSLSPQARLDVPGSLAQPPPCALGRAAAAFIVTKHRNKKRFKEQTLFLPNAINTELYKL